MAFFSGTNLFYVEPKLQFFDVGFAFMCCIIDFYEYYPGPGVSSFSLIA